MPRLDSRAIPLDYGPFATAPLLGNLSGVAFWDGLLWTVSDEGRTVECLMPAGAGYVLHRQIVLDDLIAGLPGRGTSDEIDLESIDISDGVLWLCGSHSMVRAKPRQPGQLNEKIHERPSRSVLMAGALDGGSIRAAGLRHAPFSGKGSLRAELFKNAYLAPFAALPSKEGGLDIEGLTVWQGEVYLGLRGPKLSSVALVARLGLAPKLRIDSVELNFLDLDGLGLRDLIRHDDGLLVLAGPTSEAPGPFRLYVWHPLPGPVIQKPELVFAWPETPEKPEGICPDPAVSGALIVLYDSPKDRIAGSVYWADRLHLP